MSSYKVQDSVDLQVIFFNKLNRRLSDRNDITPRDTELSGLLQALLPDITHDNPGSDIKDDLEGVKAEPSKAKEEDGLVLFDLASPGDGMKGRVHCVCCHGGLSRGHTCTTCQRTEMK